MDHRGTAITTSIWIRIWRWYHIWNRLVIIIIIIIIIVVVVITIVIVVISIVRRIRCGRSSESTGGGGRIGDTTQPIPSHILTGLVDGATKLGNPDTYTGYGDVQGRTDLRQKIADTLYAGTGIGAEEVFVSGMCISYWLAVADLYLLYW